VCTHTRKMGEIAPVVPPKGAKTCFFLFSMQRGPSATYPAPISTIFEIKDVNWFLHTYTGENFFRILHGVSTFQKQLRWILSRVWTGVFVCELQLKRQNFGRRESFLWLVNIPRMCLLYVSFGGGRTVWAI